MTKLSSGAAPRELVMPETYRALPSAAAFAKALNGVGHLNGRAAPWSSQVLFMCSEWLGIIESL